MNIAAPAQLPLRDIHLPPAPSPWPPAPGWWLVAGIVFAVLLLWLVLRLRRQRRRRALARLFDEAVARGATPAERIAAMSELLRRAARRVDPAADRLSGEAWLRFLDRGLATPVFRSGPGRVLHDGAFRRDIAEHDVEGLRVLARDRFLGWMAR